MDTAHYSKVVTLAPEDNRRLQDLCGRCDENIQLIEKRLFVRIRQRGYKFSISGKPKAVERAGYALEKLYSEASGKSNIASKEIHLYLQALPNSNSEENLAKTNPQLRIRTGRTVVTARGKHQIDYIRNMSTKDINFGIGPAGTGKTFLAVACAVQALEEQKVSRIILVRPIVEAGERLGFLPGDIAQKIHPYLRPLYDSLHEMLGADLVTQMLERDIIELVPLAFMRGRSLNDSYILLDEGQNATVEQMKMFLTRIGFNSRAVITGDATQIDLPEQQSSGLVHAVKTLKNIDGIGITRFKTSDVVRHPLVQRIVEAYEKNAILR